MIQGAVAAANHWHRVICHEALHGSSSDMAGVAEGEQHAGGSGSKSALWAASDV